MIEWTPASTSPTEPGWYVAKLRHSDKPIVCWWQSPGRGWRYGATKHDVTAWIGPLAEGLTR